MMLEQLTPFQNSNRIPVTLVDALIPDLSSLAGPKNALRSSMEEANMDEVRALVVAVGYAMQPLRLAARRPEAVAFLAEHYESHSRYFQAPEADPALVCLVACHHRHPRQKPTAGSRLCRRLRRARTSLGQWLLSAPGTRRNSTESAA
jgi:hypothetical protein